MTKLFESEFLHSNNKFQVTFLFHSFEFHQLGKGIGYTKLREEIGSMERVNTFNEVIKTTRC